MGVKPRKSRCRLLLLPLTLALLVVVVGAKARADDGKEMGADRGGASAPRMGMPPLMTAARPWLASRSAARLLVWRNCKTGQAGRQACG